MSDTYAWPPGSPADRIMRVLAAHRDQLRALASGWSEDDPRRAAVEAAALLWENTAWEVSRELAGPVRVVASAAVPAVGERREVGANTSYKIRHFVPNQGPK